MESLKLHPNQSLPGTQKAIDQALWMREAAQASTALAIQWETDGDPAQARDAYRLAAYDHASAAAFNRDAAEFLEANGMPETGDSCRRYAALHDKWAAECENKSEPEYLAQYAIGNPIELTDWGNIQGGTKRECERAAARYERSTGTATRVRLMD